MISPFRVPDGCLQDVHRQISEGRRTTTIKASRPGPDIQFPTGHLERKHAQY